MNLVDIPAPVFVTGAGGLIGSAICAELNERGVPTRALLAPTERSENIIGLRHVSIIRGDVRNAQAIRTAARSCASVIHVAALNTLWHRPARDFYAINVKGTRNVCQAALEAGVKMFVFTSSCEVLGPARHASLRLGGEADGHADETTPLDFKRVKGHYERSKFLAELAVHEYEAEGLPTAIIRPTAVIGPGDIHGSPPGALIRAFLDRRIPAYYDAGINVVDSRDVAAAHIAALAKRSRGRTFIVGGHNIRLKELFDEISNISGVPAPKTTVGYKTALAAAMCRALASLFTNRHPGITVNGIRTIRHPWHFDSSRARQELGVEPRPLSETVRDAVEWHMKAVTRNS